MSLGPLLPAPCWWRGYHSGYQWWIPQTAPAPISRPCHPNIPQYQGCPWHPPISQPSLDIPSISRGRPLPKYTSSFAFNGGWARGGMFAPLCWRKWGGETPMDANSRFFGTQAMRTIPHLLFHHLPPFVLFRWSSNFSTNRDQWIQNVRIADNEDDLLDKIVMWAKRAHLCVSGSCLSDDICIKRATTVLQLMKCYSNYCCSARQFGVFLPFCFQGLNTDLKRILCIILTFEFIKYFLRFARQRLLISAWWLPTVPLNPPLFEADHQRGK